MPSPALNAILFTPPWTPARLGAAALAWFDAADATTVALNSGNVSAWASKAPMVASAAQGTAANQPAYTAAALNGLPVVRFDGTNDMLTTGSVTMAATTLDVLLVGKRSGTGTYDSFGGMVNNSGTGWAFSFAGGAQEDWQNNDMFCFGNGYTTGRAPRAVALTPAAATDAAYHVFRAEIGATAAIAIDGTAATLRSSAAGAFPTVSDVLNLGNSVSTSADYLIGDIAEMVIAADLSVANLQKTEGYLAWKWGLQANLPASHPYKNRRP